MDLTSELTVFIITTGEPSTAECRARLEAQDCKFRIEIIDRVAPMWRAFQMMLDRCETPYYVQVDADMLLEPHAVRTLYESLAAQPDNVAMYVGWLWGDDVRRPIQGVKCYRHEICQRFPYADSVSCEVPQLQAMATAGFRYEEMPEPRDQAGCLGFHFALQTPEMTFRRWQRLMQKHRKLSWMGWLAPYPRRLLDWYREDPNPINLAALVGIMAGLTGPLPPDAEDDFRQPPPDFARLAEAFFESAPVNAGPRELVLYLTDRCNFRCQFCRRQVAPDDTVISGRPDIDPDMVGDVLDKFPSVQSVCLAGFGEPLLHPRLSEIVQIIASRGLTMGLITNGSLLFERADEVAGWPLAYLSVSLNAASATDHARLNGSDTWGQVLAGIGRMAQSPVRTGVSMVVGRRNVAQIPAFLALARELEVQFVHLLNVLPHAGPDDPDFRENVITVDCPELLAIEAFHVLPGAELVEVWPVPIDLAGPQRCLCQSPFISMGLDGYGQVSPCRRVRPPGAWPIKDLHGRVWQPGYTWPNVWKGEPFRALRAALTGDADLSPECRVCFGNWSQ